MKSVKMQVDNLDIEEFKRRHAKLQEIYGDSEGNVAENKCKQAWAEFFARTGWTLDQIAAEEGKSLAWVARMLRLARSR